MKKVLVTGANGQLGKTIRQTVNDGINGLEFVFTSKEDLDITFKNKLDNFFAKQVFDYCINCAAYTNVDQAEKTPEIAHRVNAEGVKNLAEICKQNETILIHISTDYVFDGEKRAPYKVTDNTNPINVYGQSKLLGENYIQDIMKEYFIIRTSWLYSKFGNNFLSSIISKIKEGTELHITTSQIGTPTSCQDLSKFIFYIIKNEKVPYGVYHYTSKGEASWFDFAAEIGKHYEFFKLERLNPVKEFKTIAKRPSYSVLDKKKTENVYELFNNWRLSVKKTIQNLD